MVILLCIMTTEVVNAYKVPQYYICISWPAFKDIQYHGISIKDRIYLFFLWVAFWFFFFFLYNDYDCLCIYRKAMQLWGSFNCFYSSRVKKLYTFSKKNSAKIFFWYVRHKHQKFPINVCLTKLCKELFNRIWLSHVV